MKQAGAGPDRHRRRHPPADPVRTCTLRTWGSQLSTRNSGSASRTRSGSRRCSHTRRHADPVGHPDPPDAEHGDERHPGHERAWKSRPRTGTRSRPTSWSTTPASSSRPSAGSFAGAARSTTSTTKYRDASTPAPPRSRSGSRRRGSASPTARWRRRALPKVWRQLMEQEIDILVCTTIIETGVDVLQLSIPSSSKMPTGWAFPSSTSSGAGSAARSRRAYAYFTFQRGKVLTEVATKRLNAIREFTRFGSGFRIATAGPGDPRRRQHPRHPASTGIWRRSGYDMYLRLLV